MSDSGSKWVHALTIAAALTASTAAFAATHEKTLTLDTRSLQSMKIVAGAGFLHVQGVEGGEQVEVLATIVGDDDKYRLTLEKHGDAVVLTSETKEWNIANLIDSPRIDLTVKVPSRLALDIKDGSGDMKITAMKGAAKIVDGSGSITIDGHQGKIDLDDGSGDIDMNGITGNIQIVDGSGDLTAAGVVGNLDVRDGSGSIKIHNVDGHVSIHDGSGNIAVADIKQGLTISESGSGGLSMARVENGIDINE